MKKKIEGEREAETNELEWMIEDDSKAKRN